MKQANQPNPSNNQNLPNVNYTQNLLLQNLIATAQGISPMQQLGLKYDINNQKDINELRNILSKNLSYPSTEIAQTHLKANRLGTLDLKQNRSTVEQLENLIDQNTKFCPCCGLLEQADTITLKTKLSDILHVGVSTYFYFLTIQHLIILLTLMVLVFSGYSLATNLQASRRYKQALNGGDVSDEQLTYQGVLAISLGSKCVYNSYYGESTFNVQCWLGVVVIVLWGIIFVFIEYRQQKVQDIISLQSKTASQYTLVFKNMPKDLSTSQLQSQLIHYQNKVKQKASPLPHLAQRQIKIAKINEAAPFYLDQSTFDNKQLKQVNDQYAKSKKIFINWIKQRQKLPKFTTSEQQRQQTYHQFKHLTHKKSQILRTISQDIIHKKKQNKKFIQTVPAFVTFSTSYNKQFLQQMHNEQAYMYYLRRLPCFDPKSKFFNFKLNDGTNRQRMAIITPAPQPEDIIWTNLGQYKGQMIKKKMLTFGVTLVILTLSFGAIYGLSSLQHRLTVDKQHNATTSTLLSILISLCIAIQNIIIQQILRILTVHERNETFTQQQVSLGLKAVLAVLGNSILIPIMVNQFFTFNTYGVNGLADDIFYLSITNSLVSPIMKICDTYFHFTRIQKWYYSKPINKLSLDQNQLNTRSQYLEFQVGYEYIYIVNLFLFTCFFVSLQPIIPIFAIIGMFIMYWAQRFALLNRCKRPTPGNNTVNTTMYQLIFAGPLLYSLGSFCWSNFMGDLPSGKIPNIAALVTSIFILVMPFQEISKQFVNHHQQPQQFFEEDRIFLPSEYDRLNPLTSQEGIKNYLDYIAQYQKNLQNKTPEQLNLLQQIFIHQCGVGHRRQQQMLPSPSNFLNFSRLNDNLSNQIMLKKFFGGTDNNIMNPYLIGDAVMQSKRRYINKKPIRRKQPLQMVVQNWLTTQQTIRNSSTQNINKQNKSPPMNPMIKLSQHLANNQFGHITYANSKDSDNNQLNLVFSNPTNQKSSQIQSRSSQNIQQNQVPMTLSLNLFGNLLNYSDKKNKYRQKSSK